MGLPTKLSHTQARLQIAFHMLGFLFEAEVASGLRECGNIRSIIHAGIVIAANISGRLGSTGGLRRSRKTTQMGTGDGETFPTNDVGTFGRGGPQPQCSRRNWRLGCSAELRRFSIEASTTGSRWCDVLWGGGVVNPLEPLVSLKIVKGAPVIKSLDLTGRPADLLAAGVVTAAAVGGDETYRCDASYVTDELPDWLGCCEGCGISGRASVQCLSPLGAEEAKACIQGLYCDFFWSLVSPC